MGFASSRCAGRGRRRGRCLLPARHDCRVPPQVVGRVRCRAGRDRRAGLEHQVERLGPDPPIGVQQHDGAVNGAVMIWPTAPPIETNTRASNVVIVDFELSKRIWPVRLNGIDTAPETILATIVVSSRIPNTRQKSPFTSLTDRATRGRHQAAEHDQWWSETEHRPEVDQQRDRSEAEWNADGDRCTAIGRAGDGDEDDYNGHDEDDRPDEPHQGVAEQGKQSSADPLPCLADGDVRRTPPAPR